MENDKKISVILKRSDVLFLFVFEKQKNWENYGICFRRNWPGEWDKVGKVVQLKTVFVSSLLLQNLGNLIIVP